MMRTDALTESTSPAACLATAAVLLARAADLTWAQAQTDPDPQLRFRGLGLDLAASRALELTPVGISPVPVAALAVEDPLELMRSAERALRVCPIEDLPVGSSQLVVAVCDLVGEHVT
ncbi:hypothetical protein [Knoellia koreensis]|jgi:hypothetical protein|uniref:Uncharacterized protein n=1 Tax=Knoellia koreensis TaxID=2730921 RepID=A0A849HG73_9MICO|nr:hypothetical protein [Knoellia sp. DB2414S]NNM46945.1 hypothetical protein [Knoellia sp. DB2414S]